MTEPETLDEREKRWLDFWYFLAGMMATRSKDPRTKVGSVIIGRDRRHTALGYNGFPPGIADTEERLAEREVKYHFIQHAERAAIDNAQFDLDGATLYVTMYPCSECAKSIVAKRIKRLVCPPPPRDEPWATSAKFATEMLQEAGIEVVLMGGEAKPHAA